MISMLPFKYISASKSFNNSSGQRKITSCQPKQHDGEMMKEDTKDEIEDDELINNCKNKQETSDRIKRIIEESKSDSKECIICYQEFDTTDCRKIELLPCRHKIICEECAQTIEKDKYYKCPVDKKYIQGYNLC